MTDGTAPKRRTLRRSSPERLTELARGVVRNEYLVVDLTAEPEWRTSLLMMTDSILAVRNLGVILVPVGPHLGGYWINGRVPGVTLSCVLVAKGDLPDLQRRIKRMNVALYSQD